MKQNNTSRTQKKIKPKNVELVPETPEEVKKHFFKKAWVWFRKKPVMVKVILLLILLLILIGLSRLNLLGEKPYSLTQLFLPFYIPGIDTPDTIIPLHVQITAEGDMGVRELKIGENIFSGEKVHIVFRADISCWLTVFCIDSNGIHDLFQGTLDPSPIAGEKEYPPVSFDLDDTPGTEAYYFIASARQFTFEKVIKPALLEVFPAGNTKGPVQNRYELRLKRGYTAIEYFFNYLPRN